MSTFKRPDAGESGGFATPRPIIPGLARRAAAACSQRWQSLSRARIIRACDGVAAVELAFTVPIMVAIFLGAWDFGRIIHENARVASAAGAGSAYAFHFENDQPGWVQAARDDARDTANELNITTNVFCECPGPVTVACTATCGNPPESPARQVSIQVVGEVETFFTYGFLDNPVTITKQSIIRVD